MKTIPSFSHRIRLAGLALGLALGAGPLSAQLLTPGYEAQLETWLGQGDLTFANIFTKMSGDGQTASHFHAAADYKGATFTLLKVQGSGNNWLASNLPPQIIGGFNPQSWHSGGYYNFTSANSERTAFLYNLTSGLLKRQNLDDTVGQAQTYNYVYFGPTWGSGHDLYSENNLEAGYAYNYSYGGTSFATTLTFGGADALSYYDWFSIDRLEVYTFAPAQPGPPPMLGAVPEPSTYGVVAAAALLAGVLVRRTARKGT